MEPASRLHSLSIPFSVSVAKWLYHLSSFFPLRGSHDTATLRSLPAPSSLVDAHNSACAWFLGPKAENADFFRKSVGTILNDVIHFRRNFAPEDEVRIPLLGDIRRPHPGTRRISLTRKLSPRPRSRIVCPK